MIKCKYILIEYKHIFFEYDKTIITQNFFLLNKINLV